MLSFGLSLLLLLSWAGDALARDQLVRFLAPTDADVAGFRIYQGPTPGQLVLHADLGPVPLIGRFAMPTVTGLDDATDVYLAVSAYDFAGNESPLSEAFFSARGASGPPTGVLLDEDFESRPGGVPVPDWAAYAVGLPTSPSAFLPVNGPTGRFEATLRSGPMHLVYEGPGSDVWLSYDYEGQMNLGAANGAIGVTVYGAPPQSYFLLKGWGGGTFQLSLTRGAGTIGATCVGRADTGVPVQQGRWYRFRVRAQTVGLSVVVLAKVWEEGEIEPRGWPAICLGLSGASERSGTIGLWSQRVGSAPNGWDDLKVDTELELGPSGECGTDADCNDGNACTGVETCVAGRCNAGSSLACNASRECELGACDPEVGCVYSDQSGVTCGNDDICDGIDICVAGTCETFNSSVCSADYVCGDPFCDSTRGCGKTQHPDGTPCTDGAIVGSCLAGTCRPPCRTAADCDDGNACNGAEFCTIYRCRSRPSPPDGSSCELAGAPGTCNAGWCTP